jgi:hypothetical protein
VSSDPGAAVVGVAVVDATTGAEAGAGAALLLDPKNLLRNPLALGLPSLAAWAASCTWGGRNADQGMEKAPQMSPAAASSAVLPTTTFDGRRTP